MINLPGENGWVQNNRGNGLGTISESFNLDLSSNYGKVRTTRTKRLAYTGSPSGFGEVAALEKFLYGFYVAAENGSAHDIWAGGNSPFDTLTNDTTSVEINPLSTDMRAWNSGLYVTTSNEIWRSTNGTTWSEISSDVLTSGGAHLLTDLNDTLYVTDEHYKVKSVTSGNTFQGTGSQTLNLNIPGYTAHVLMAGVDQIWCGFTNRDGGSPSLVFEWDGQTENTPTARYEINASGLMGGIVKDGVPYIVDSQGRLLAFNGGVFVEVARFPLNGRTFAGFSSSGMNERAIHPRGFAVDKDELLITVANATDQITDDNYNEFPSGVWAFSEANGLYHKYSPSFQAVANSGTTGLTDHGQFRAAEGGPMMVFESTAVGGDSTPDNGGRVVFGMGYFAGAADDASDVKYGLFADDTNDDTQKAGWLVTPKIPSAGFRDTWDTVYAAVSDLETSGDLVEVKYRTKDGTRTYCTATWGGTDRFNTTTDLSAFEQGDEVTVVQGTGSGAVAHIKSISTDGGGQVILDRDLTGVTGSSVVKLEKWTKVAKIEDIANQGGTIGESDHWLQVKLYMQWTGPRELHGIMIKSNLSQL